MEVSVSMGGFAVDCAGKAAILLPGHFNIKKRNVAIAFLFHGELDAVVKPVTYNTSQDLYSLARLEKIEEDK